MSWLMSWFESPAKKAAKTHFATMVAIAAADGQLHPNEMALLRAVAQRIKLSDREVQKVLSNPQKIKFAVPTDGKERVLMLFDMVLMMMADGKIDQREMDFVVMAAGRLGFPSSFVLKLVTGLVDAARKGKRHGQVATEAEAWLRS